MAKDPVNDPQDIKTTNDVEVAESPGTFWEWFKDNVAGVLYLPLCFGSVVFMLWLYVKLTGRAPVDELPIGAAGNFVILLVAIVTSIYTYRAFFPRICTSKAGVPWWQVLVMYAIKLWLIASFWYCISHG